MKRYNIKANLGCLAAFAAILGLVYLADLIAGDFFRSFASMQP
jgi:hypothetical protein